MAACPEPAEGYFRHRKIPQHVFSFFQISGNQCRSVVKSSLFSSELLNKLAETKAMMEATKLLMDEAINKPVVVDWLEGTK